MQQIWVEANRWQHSQTVEIYLIITCVISIPDDGNELLEATVCDKLVFKLAKVPTQELEFRIHLILFNGSYRALGLLDNGET